MQHGFNTPGFSGKIPEPGGACFMSGSIPIILIGNDSKKFANWWLDF